MAGGTAFDLVCPMFIEIGTSFFHVALQAGLLFKASQLLASGRFMGVMAGSAGQDSFSEAMALIKIELSQYILMAGGTGFYGKIGLIFRKGMNGVAGCTIMATSAMRAGGEKACLGMMTAQTNFIFGGRFLFRSKGKNGFFCPFLKMFFSPLMTDSAIFFLMRSALEIFDHSLMAG